MQTKNTGTPKKTRSKKPATKIADGTLQDDVKKPQDGYQRQLDAQQSELDELQKKYSVARQLWVNCGQSLQGRIESIAENRLIKSNTSPFLLETVKSIAVRRTNQSDLQLPLSERIQLVEGNPLTEYHSNAPQSIVSFLSLISTFNSVVTGYHGDYAVRYESAVSKIADVSKIVPKGAVENAWEDTKEWFGVQDTAKKNFEAGIKEIEAQINAVQVGLNTVLLCSEKHYRVIELCLNAAENILTVYETQSNLSARVQDVAVEIENIKADLIALEGYENTPSRAVEFYELQSRLNHLDLEYAQLPSEDISFKQAWDAFNKQFAAQFIEIPVEGIRGDCFGGAQKYFERVAGFAFPQSYIDFVNHKDEINLKDKINVTSVNISRLKLVASRLHGSTEENRMYLMGEDTKQFDAICSKSLFDSVKDGEQDQNLQARKSQLSVHFKGILTVIQADERHNEFKEYLENKFKAIEEIFSRKAEYIVGENQVYEEKKAAIESAFKNPYCNAIVCAKMISEFECYLLNERNPQLSRYNQQVWEALDQVEKDLKIFNQNVVRQNILNSAKKLDDRVAHSFHLLNRALQRTERWRVFCKFVVALFGFFCSEDWLPSFIQNYKNLEARQQALEANQKSLGEVKNELNALDKKKNELSSSREVCEDFLRIVNTIPAKIQAALQALQEHANSDDEEKNLIEPHLAGLDNNVSDFVGAAANGLRELKRLCYEENVNQELLKTTELPISNHNPFGSVFSEEVPASPDQPPVKAFQKQRS